MRTSGNQVISSRAELSAAESLNKPAIYIRTTKKQMLPNWVHLFFLTHTVLVYS